MAVVPRRELEKGDLPDLSEIETPAERYLRLDEERELREPHRDHVSLLEYYTGEFYGDN